MERKRYTYTRGNGWKAKITKGIRSRNPSHAPSVPVPPNRTRTNSWLRAVMACGHVLVPIADGSEEIETVCIVDTLVRAGAIVTLVSISGSAAVKCSRGVSIIADTMIHSLSTDDFDAIAIPGGMPGILAVRRTHSRLGADECWGCPICRGKEHL